MLEQKVRDVGSMEDGDVVSTLLEMYAFMMTGIDGSGIPIIRIVERPMDSRIFIIFFQCADQLQLSEPAQKGWFESKRAIT